MTKQEQINADENLLNLPFCKGKCNKYSPIGSGSDETCDNRMFFRYCVADPEEYAKRERGRQEYLEHLKKTSPEQYVKIKAYLNQTS